MPAEVPREVKGKTSLSSGKIRSQLQVGWYPDAFFLKKKKGMILSVDRGEQAFPEEETK